MIEKIVDSLHGILYSYKKSLGKYKDEEE